MKSVYILDDSGAYGVGMADAFQEQAEKKGIKVLGRDRLDPKAADYTAILTKIKSLNPDALYYGGVAQAGVKLAKQAYDIIPKMIKGGGDGMVSADLLTGAGFPAVEGWYATIAAPHLTDDTKAAQFVEALQGPVRHGAGRLLDHRLRRGAGHHRRGEAGGRERQAGRRAKPCATPSDRQGADHAGHRCRSTPTATWPTAPSACSRSSKDASKPLDDDLGAVPGTSGWRRSPEATASHRR